MFGSLSKSRRHMPETSWLQLKQSREAFALQDTFYRSIETSYGFDETGSICMRFHYGSADATFGQATELCKQSQKSRIRTCNYPVKGSIRGSTQQDSARASGPCKTAAIGHRTSKPQLAYIHIPYADTDQDSS